LYLVKILEALMKMVTNKELQ